MSDNITKLHLGFDVTILIAVNELDDLWARMLDDAAAKARISGRSDVADYLALRQTNDAIRRIGITWLFDSLIAIAAEANRHNAAITIEREEPHEFSFRNARMVGCLVRVRFGVRSLTVDAGWTRTPAHGFMRGGALAAARLVHFGMPKSGAELLLIKTNDGPAWQYETGQHFGTGNLREHFAVLVG